MKKVQENGCAELICSKMNAIYASKGPGNTGSKDPMIARIHSSAQIITSTISIQANEQLKINNEQC